MKTKTLKAVTSAEEELRGILALAGDAHACMVPTDILKGLATEIASLREICGAVNAGWGPVLVKKRREIDAAFQSTSKAMQDLSELMAILES